MKLPTDYQGFIHTSRYARWNDEEKRRETWEETVKRYFDFFDEHIEEGFDKKSVKAYRDHRAELEAAVLNLEVMPSMRCLMTAGPALKRDNVAGYNCAYAAVDNPKIFDEIMYILMCGTGAGFSVERQYVNQLPIIAEEFYDTATTIIVPDNRIGWATSFRELISLLYNGKIPKWDLSKLRGPGERLRTFGGRASGPAPLEALFRYCVGVFRGAAGRRLNSIECHDIICKVADVVIVGGVRRSALISLSNLSDDRMRVAKAGAWFEDNKQRALANNSACYTEKPDVGIFMKEWLSLYESKSGERGIFNRVSATKQAARNGRRDTEHEFGTNPCSEIILRSKQFCNLTEVVVRSGDSLDALKRKVRLATILGTLQATLTNFRYLSKVWRQNTEEERLLGVSLTGVMDHAVLNGSGDNRLLKESLECMREEAVATNKEWAGVLGIPQSSAITCVKPSGTVSQLVNSASGIHARHAPYYIRTVRSDKKDPLAQFMTANGFPVEDDLQNVEHNCVFSFPIKAPEGSVFRDDRTAIEQLELWKLYQEHWCEHKPSISVSLKEGEWMEAGAWVYNNWDSISGVAFFPFSNHAYPQAPYQDLTQDQYEGWVAKMPKGVDWSGLKEYEQEDQTKSQHDLACSAGICEL